MGDWPAAVQRGEPASHYDALPDAPRGDLPAQENEAKATVMSSIFNLANNIMGAGMLVLPWAMAQSTLIPGCLLMVMASFCSTSSLLMLGRCCEVTGAYTFKGLAEKAFGRNAGIAIQCVVLSYTTGTCIAYVIFSGEFSRDFFKYCAYSAGQVANATNGAEPSFLGAYYYLTDPIYSKVGLALFVLLPICLVRDLHMLRHTSTLAVLCIIYTTVMVAAFSGSEPVSPTFEMAEVQPSIWRAYPIFIVAFTAHYNGPRFYGELKGRSLSVFTKVAVPAFMLCAFIYISCAVAGYHRFGYKTCPSILACFPIQSLPAAIARMAFAVVMVTSYPIAFFAIRDSLIQLIFPLHVGRFGTVFHALTVGMVAFTATVGILFPKISFVLDINGAAFGSLIVYVLPSVMFLKLRADSRGKAEAVHSASVYSGNANLAGVVHDQLFESSLDDSSPVLPRLTLMNCLAVFVALLGMVSGVMGLYQTIVSVHPGE